MIDFLKSNKTENIDKDPAIKNMKVFKVRHGASLYKELEGAISHDTLDITKEGVKQIQKTAEYLQSKLSKERDIIVFTHSPRRRAANSAEVLSDELKNAGFTIINDTKSREVRHKLDGAQLRTYEGSLVEPGTDAYAQALYSVLENVWNTHADDWFTLAWAQNDDYQIKNNTHRFETLGDVKKRSKDHLAFLVRVAKRFQTRLAEDNKRLVVIEVGHGEGFDEFLDNATGGHMSLQNDEIVNGGVLEMDIPSGGQTTIQSHMWASGDGEKKLKDVDFDYLKRNYVSTKPVV